jgi:hypothetical protein
MKRFSIMTLLLGMVCLSSGCFFTKIVTVPMRIVGAVVSIVPIVGNTGDAAIDGAADIVDELPF